jgi:hypothetical protein
MRKRKKRFAASAAGPYHLKEASSMSAITPLGEKFPSYYVDDRLDHFDIDTAWHWLSNYAYWVRTKYE